MEYSLKAFSKKKCLRDMTKKELAGIPKEMIIAYTSDEIAFVYDKLSKTLRKDPEIMNYIFCTEHYNKQEGDVIDGPPARRIFCCYCKIKEVNIGSANKMDTPKTADRNCCVI